MPAPFATDAAWQGIVALYADPALERELLRAQDERGQDVVLLLFARWVAAQGHALDAAALAEAELLVAPWRAQVVAPLRALRRSMKALSGDAAWREAVRDKVKAAELAAERAQVQMLCEWLHAR